VVSTPVITALAHAVPESASQQELWHEFFADHYHHDRLAKRVWQGSGVRTRHGVALPNSVDLSDWSTGARMQRYVDDAAPLAKEALSVALGRAARVPADLGLFAVVSCTGYTTPGLDVILARDLGMSSGVRRLCIGHMGCYAALPGLAAASDYVAAQGRPAALLCVELPSLHVQPAPKGFDSSRLDPAEMEQVVAHALFSDAASAVIVEPAGESRHAAPGLCVVDVEAWTDPTTSDHMTWSITDFGFRMGLSARVPDALEGYASEAVRSLLTTHGLTIDDIRGWAIHPGGPKIVEAIGRALGLDRNALAPSYEVLGDHGNCSSSTVLLVLERLLTDRRFQSNDHIVALAFGPGLTLYAALLRIGGLRVRADD
jgi:alkylresorcinol/alkylpyrone synthase